jgi:hypothetical protein
MVPIQHIRGIGAVLASLAGASVLFGATPAFGFTNAWRRIKSST